MTIAMSREKALKVLLEDSPDETTAERLDLIEGMLRVFLSAIVVRQKDACEIADVTPQTVITWRSAASSSHFSPTDRRAVI